MKKVIPAVIGGVAAVGIIAGCSTTTVAKTPAHCQAGVMVNGKCVENPTSGIPKQPAPTKTANPTSGPLGTSFTVTDPNTGPNADQTAVYTVQAIRVIDPATPDNSFDTAPAGDHLVGVEFVIKGVSGSESDDANGDATVTGNDNQTYQSGFEGLAAGTNWNSGTFTTSPGSTSVGWVSMEVKDGVSVQSVQWTPNGGINGGSVTWIGA